MAETQAALNGLVRECHEGAGGFEADSVGRVGVGGLVRGVDVGVFGTRSQEGILEEKEQSQMSNA